MGRRHHLVLAGHKHWHGATPIIAMTHIAIQKAVDGVAVAWMEKVIDDEYLKGTSNADA